MKVFSLGEMIAHLATVEADMKVAQELAVVKTCKLVAKTAKNMLGHEQPFWPALEIDNRRQAPSRVGVEIEPLDEPSRSLILSW